MTTETHRLAITASGMLITAIRLPVGVSEAVLRSSLEAAVSAESREARETLVAAECPDVAILKEGDEIPEGWGVVYRGCDLGWLPNDADIAIARKS